MMLWRGNILKEILKDNGYSFAKFAKEIGTSYYFVNKWIKGDVPKGTYLVKMCKLLDVDPDIFFEDDCKIVVRCIKGRE